MLRCRSEAGELLETSRAGQTGKVACRGRWKSSKKPAGMHWGGVVRTELRTKTQGRWGNRCVCGQYKTGGSFNCTIPFADASILIAKWNP